MCVALITIKGCLIYCVSQTDSKSNILRHIHLSSMSNVTVTTLAGGQGQEVDGSDDGQGTSASFSSPTGIAISKDASFAIVVR